MTRSPNFVLLLLLNQTFKKKKQGCKKQREIIQRVVIITVKAVTVFVNISLNMRKSRAC